MAGPGLGKLPLLYGTAALPGCGPLKGAVIGLPSPGFWAQTQLVAVLSQDRPGSSLYRIRRSLGLQG